MLAGIPELLVSLDKTDFSGRNARQTYLLIEGFYRKYSSLPRSDELLLWVRSAVDEASADNVTELLEFIDEVVRVVDADIKKELLWDIAHDHVAEVKVERALVTAAENKKDIPRVLSLLTDAAKFDMSRQNIARFRDLSRLSVKSNLLKKVPVGYNSFDREILRGGVLNPSLNIWAGKPFAGKTLMLTNLCVNAVMNGQRVIYFTMELPEDMIMMRIDCALLGMTYQEAYHVDNKEITRRALENIKNRCTGEVLVFKYPAGIPVSKLALHCDLAYTIYGPYEQIFVDYLGLLTPSRKVDGMYERGKAVCDELVQLSEERKVPVHAAAQLNKGSSNVSVKDLNEGHLAESWGIQQVAYNVCLLSKPSTNLLSHKLLCKWVKNRAGGVMSTNTLYQVPDTYRIVDNLDEFFNLASKARVFLSDDEVQQMQIEGMTNEDDPAESKKGSGRQRQS